MAFTAIMVPAFAVFSWDTPRPPHIARPPSAIEVPVITRRRVTLRFTLSVIRAFPLLAPIVSLAIHLSCKLIVILGTPRGRTLRARNSSAVKRQAHPNPRAEDWNLSELRIRAEMPLPTNAILSDDYRAVRLDGRLHPPQPS